MPAEPNISGKMRALYVAIGIGLAAWGLFGAEPVWARITWLTLGGAFLVGGIIGFCPGHWLLGRSSKPAGGTSG